MTQGKKESLAHVINDLEKFRHYDWSEEIFSIGLSEIKQYFRVSLRRIQALEQYLANLFVGTNMKTNIRMLLAAAIAQEPVLFVGGPGLAKTELAIAFFESIGLRKPVARPSSTNGKQDVTAIERDLKENKYYEYLLSAFTVPEELFGPYRIDELKNGKFIRNNTNMLTGQGVKGCFLDEVFKGSSNILNTLLTLINERRYFNNGVFFPADLRIIVGAANGTPGGGSASFSGRMEMPGKSGNELMAFFDRFTIRLHFQSPDNRPIELRESDYYKIRQRSIEREAFKIRNARPFEFQDDKACLNDILLLSRVLFPHEDEEFTVLAQPNRDWEEKFLRIGMFLSAEPSGLARISPRKMTRLEKMAYALALLDYDTEAAPDKLIPVNDHHLGVFNHIWESEMQAGQIPRLIRDQFKIDLLPTNA